MREIIDVCLGCGNKLDQGFVFEVVTYTPNINMCNTCQKSFKKLFATLRSDALQLIERNITLNEMFDALIEDEEILKYKTENQESVYLTSTMQLREYMLSLLEEVHSFAYHATFESHLFCDLFEEADKMFFSERYFLTNCAIKTIGAWEKIFRFYSLYYEIQLDTNSKNNSLNRLQKKLNKTDFVQTDIYKAFVKLKSNGSFMRIDEARKYNDHNVSYHLNGKNYRELSDVAKSVLESTDVLYKGLEEALQLMKYRTRIAKKTFIEKFDLVTGIDENIKVFKKKAKKIKKNFSFKDISSINQQSVYYMQWANNRLDEVNAWKVRYSNPPMQLIYYRLIDVTVRLHESARSLGYATKMFGDAVKFHYADLDRYWIRFDGMNYRYFIHSALIRIYAVYDKLGMIMQDSFEIDLGKATFEQIIEFIRTSEDAMFYNSLLPLKISNRILSHPSYKKLYDSRQDFFHLLVKQDFMNPSYKEVLDTELMIAIVDNCKMVYELIESIDVALVHFHQIGTYHSNKANIEA